MTTTMLRGVFTSHSAADSAANQLREHGLRQVQVQSEPQPVTRQAVKTAPVFAFSVLIGAVIGGILGFIIGFPFIGLPSVRNDVATIILTMLAWAGGGVIFGMICGAIFGAIFGSSFSRKEKTTSNQTSTSTDHEQAVVLVSVENELAAQQAQQWLRELNAQSVETYAGERS
jgi:outer membrane lipoprotein SlyB